MTIENNLFFVSDPKTFVKNIAFEYINFTLV